MSSSLWVMLDAGIELVTRAMEAWQQHEGVQCNCCLAIMALVRGTGSVCQVMLQTHAFAPALSLQCPCSLTYIREWQLQPSDPGSCEQLVFDLALPGLQMAVSAF